MEQTKEHILACLSSAPSNAKIIRTAATMARAFQCSFTALFVQTPNFEAMPDRDKERLRQHTHLAEELGATVETVFGDDVSYQIAEYARLSGVTKIVIGRSAVRRKHLWSKPALTEKLTAIAPNLDIHIIPDASVDGSYRPQKAKRKVSLGTMLRDWTVSAGILLLATLVGYAFSKVGFTEANIIAIYLLAVLLTSMATSTRSSYVLSAVGSVLVFNYFFTSPRFSLRVYEHGAPMTFLIMIVAALIVGTLTDRLKSQVKQSAQAAYRTNLLFETNQMLQKAACDEEVFQVAQAQLHKLLNRNLAVSAGVAADGRKIAATYLIKTASHIYGSVVVEGGQPLSAFENSILLSILGECALTLENMKNAKEKEEAKLLAENEKLRANLLRSISHDLRTPLTAISGNAGMLLSDDGTLSPETKAQMYSDIYDDSAWLNNLVENLLAVTRIEEGHIKLKLQPQLVEEVVCEAMQHISRKKTEHTITVTHQDDLLLAMCDARLLVQVIINLVDNAIKYTPAGSQIDITTKGERGCAVISVADNGPGISEGEKNKVFQMFYTGGNQIADSRRSLGLGLSLCKSIVTAHGGEISVSDNQPCGTVFTFTIPSGEVEVHE
ncbi:MAG: ATP-binding protein [Faecousia sp.]